MVYLVEAEGAFGHRSGRGRFPPDPAWEKASGRGTVFSYTIVAQFWAFAADMCSAEQGKRLFPIIGGGSSLGAVALGIGMLGVGFSPEWTLDETPRMPKQRYGVMTRYMPQVGARGLDMMYRTATVQVTVRPNAAPVAPG